MDVTCPVGCSLGSSSLSVSLSPRSESCNAHLCQDIPHYPAPRIHSDVRKLWPCQGVVEVCCVSLKMSKEQNS